MALATTCPQCKTSFKVVPDQLKLRRGLVRCGVCQHVFSGIDYLRYVDDAARAAQRAARAAGEGDSSSGGAPSGVAADKHTPTDPAGARSSGDVSPRVVTGEDAAGPQAPGSLPGLAAPLPPPDTDPTIRPPRQDLPTPDVSAPPPSLPGSDAAAEPPRPAPDRSVGDAARIRRIDPWAAAAEAAHERSLRDDMPLLPGVSDTPRVRFGSSAARGNGGTAGPPPPAEGSTGAALDRAPAGRRASEAPPGRHDPARPLGSGGLVPVRAPVADPRTVISPDDELKTAFFLTDSSFGPLSADTDESDRQAVGSGTVTARPGSPSRSDFAPEGSTADGPETIVRPEADWPLPLRPDAYEPTRIASDDPLGPPTRFAPDTEMPGRRHRSSAAVRLGAAIPVADGAAEPAIDYFTNGRGRQRGLGLALSPVAWAVASMLTLLLGLQAVVGWRDNIAARLPILAPVMSAVLSPFGLDIEPPRDLSALTIESFELQAAGSPNLLQMTAVLRNRGGHAVGFPAMELSLTDSAGALVVRKVITADVYLAGASGAEHGLDARSEWPLRLSLEHGGLRPTGYSVALFYP
jgi:predicted Zn finger-like uncharacterized protein